MPRRPIHGTVSFFCLIELLLRLYVYYFFQKPPVRYCSAVKFIGSLDLVWLDIVNLQFFGSSMYAVSMGGTNSELKTSDKVLKN